MISLKNASMLIIVAIALCAGVAAHKFLDQARRSYVMNVGITYCSFSIEHMRRPDSIDELANWMAMKRSDQADETIIEDLKSAFIINNEKNITIISKKLTYLQVDLDRLINSRLTHDDRAKDAIP